MAEKKFNIRDLWPIGVLLLLVLGQIALFTPSSWQTIFLVIGLSYGQNMSFTLSARARTRNNVLYHLCAVLISSLVAFLTFRTILGSAANFPLGLLLAYVAGTISGSLTGGFAAMFVERLTGARMDAISKEEARRNQERNQKVALRVFPILLTVGWALQFWLFPNESLLPLVIVTGSVFLPDMAYSMRTWIQNRDNYYLTLGVGLLTGCVDFFRWIFLIKFQMQWNIFIPYATGGTGGSITGSLAASSLTKWFDTITGTKSSSDAHVNKGVVKKPDFRPVWALLGIVALAVLIFPPKNPLSTAWFILGTIFMQISFGLISRARQRNNSLYHLLAAICSNGSWFFVLHLIANMAKDDPRLCIPFAVGSAIGTFIGSWLSMQIEVCVGALADSVLKSEKAELQKS